MQVHVGSAPDSWGVWFPADEKQTPWERCLDEIAEAGYWRIGLDGEADTTIGEAIGQSRVALVLGAEGEGLRHNSIAHCDIIAKLPISPRMESLNVSNAAAIALYAATNRQDG